MHRLVLASLDIYIIDFLLRSSMEALKSEEKRKKCFSDFHNGFRSSLEVFKDSSQQWMTCEASSHGDYVSLPNPFPCREKFFSLGSYKAIKTLAFWFQSL